MEKEQKKKLYKMGLPIIMGTILLLGVSYAWLTLTLNGTKTNVLKAGTLSLTLTDTATNGINIEGAVPMLDEVGVTTSPYTFTLTNNGTVESEYTIYLDDVTLDPGETKLPDNVIKYNLVKDNVSMSTALLSATGSNPNRVLDSGVIKPNETYNYDLRLWLDENATIAVSGQVFKGKIRVEASQIKQAPESCFVLDETGTKIVSYICGLTVPSPEMAMTPITNTNAVNNITDIVIPSEINGKTITGVYGLREAMDACGATDLIVTDYKNMTVGQKQCTSGKLGFAFSGITSVKIPNSIISIGIDSFAKNQLTSVVIPDSVTTIKQEAFAMNQLTHIAIPNTVTSIEQYAFWKNQLTNITIPNSVTRIGMAAFGHNQLSSVTIPENVTTIGRGAFFDNQLTEVIIKGKSSTADFIEYEKDENGPFGWADGYSDANITWQP